MHVGRIIRQKVAERKITVVWLAKQMSCTRTNIYKIFDRKSIDTDTLIRLSVILDYDFFQHISDNEL
ncbi:MAG: XRE family transcriptional regulator [Bacteroidales bacterium]|nr:XRE family transcriptional regulator [Bacteroidales bacterium]